MTIKEVEKVLGIPRATIRFYEKENLICPKRGKNAYREYSEEDVAVLKKVVILRKIGMQVSSIREFLDGKASLQELLEKNLMDLQEQMKELEGAISICQIMQGRKEDIHTFNENYYWEEMYRQEKSGGRFFELVNDAVEFEKRYFLQQFGIGNKEGRLLYGPVKSILLIIATCLAGGVCYVIIAEKGMDSFRKGLLIPFILFIAGSIYELPLYFLERKHPKTARVIRKNLFITAITIITLMILIWGMLFVALLS